MSKDNRELSESELDFIQEKLGNREDTQLDFNEGTVTVSKIDIRKSRFYKRITFWIPFLIITPIVIASAFMIILSQLNVTLLKDFTGVLDQTSSTEIISEYISPEILNNISTLIEIYEYRWIIVAVIFTIFYTILGIVLLTGIILEKESTKEEKTHGE